jgi:hypothetical protein
MGGNRFELADDCADILLPTQYNALIHDTAERSGEVRLMLALLTDAIECLFGRATGHPEQREAEQQEALMWVSGRWQAPFAFEDVCHILGIEPGMLRAVLFRHLRARTMPCLPCRGLAAARSLHIVAARRHRSAQRTSERV